MPDEFVADVVGLRDIFTYGLRPEFGQHLKQTLQREATLGDKAAVAYEEERRILSQTKHFMANGHTFVPQDDNAMEAALKLAEANDGSLRTCWGILPLQITVKRDFRPWPNAQDREVAANVTRIEIGYEWKIDAAYWDHCQRFKERFPITMAKIAENIERQLKR